MGRGFDGEGKLLIRKVGFVEGFTEGGVEVGEVFPEEVAAVDDLAAAHVEEVDGEHLVFEVEAEDLGVVVISGGDALLVLGLVNGGDLVAEAGGELELHVLGGGFHAGGEALFELVGAAFEEELDVADGLLVDVGGGEAFDAGAETAFDVVLEAGAGVVALEVDLAGGDEEGAVDEVDEEVGKVAGEVGAEVEGDVLAEASRMREPVLALAWEASRK